MTVLAINPLAVFQWALTLTGLLALGSAVVIYFKGAGREVTIKMHEEALAIRDVRIKDLSGDVSTLKAENDGLKQTVRVLENTANSGDLIRQQSDQITRQFSAVLASIEGVLLGIKAHHEEMLGVTEQLHSDLAGLPLGIASAIRDTR